jgi:hypothetical protein
MKIITFLIYFDFQKFTIRPEFLVPARQHITFIHICFDVNYTNTSGQDYLSELDFFFFRITSCIEGVIEGS